MEVKQAASEVTTTKMEGPGEVMRKDPKKIKKGKRLVEWNHRNREELARAQKNESKSKLTLGQYYSVGAVMTVGALGVFGYYIY